LPNFDWRKIDFVFGFQSAIGNQKSAMLKVGLTGSIAVGKSFVLSVLKDLGCHVIDADQIAREVVTPGAPGFDLLIQTFGKDIVSADGTLNRAKLGAIVFADKAKRQQLNAILHPSIIAAQDRELQRVEKQDPNGIAVVDAALMIESGGYKRFAKLIVVYCEPEIQIQRLLKRDRLSREDAERRIASQMPQEEKKKYADFVIDTSGSFESTHKQVEVVFSELRKLAEV
jgi:dephospho-CoA kinase